MKPQTRNLAILAACLIVLVFILKRGSKPRPKMPNVAPQAKTEQNPEQPQKNAAVPPPSPAPTLNYPEIERSRVGLNTVKYGQKDSGQSHVKVRLHKAGVCHAGDYEAMVSSVGQTGKILLSLEPISPHLKEAKAAQKTISLQDIDAEMLAELAVDPQKKGIYGVFLCSDQEGSGTCLGKSPADFNTILGGHAPNAGKNAIFYFQILVVQPAAAGVYGGTLAGWPDAGEQLAKDKVSASVEEDFKLATKLMRGVKSMAPVTTATISETIVNIPIATLDGKKCGG